jgi:hypothetical protein
MLRPELMSANAREEDQGLTSDLVYEENGRTLYGCSALRTRVIGY